MFDSTIRRSVATLGVVAGLLTAAAPASALGTQVGSEGVKAPGSQLMRAGDAQDTQASLGRENSIECLVRAQPLR